MRRIPHVWDPETPAATESPSPAFSLDEALGRIEADRPVSGTYERAVKMLGFRARSVAEMRRQLIQKGEPVVNVDQAIDRLCSQRLLDDGDFARQFARTKLLAAGASRRRIVQELARRGVSREVADTALAELEEQEGVQASAAAQRVAEKKWKSLSKLDDVTRRRRLYAFLARRGFDSDEIRSVMSTLAADVES